MSIIINKKNSARIERSLKEVNGHATDRLIEDLADLDEIARKASKEMSDLGLPLASHKGAVACYRMGIDLPNAYKYIPKYTSVTLTRRASGWALTEAMRVAGNLKQAERINLTLTAEQASEATERFVSKFSVA